MKPIISNVCTTAQEISKWLNKKLKEFDKFDCISVKNAVLFAEEVKDIKLGKHDIMVSFDVESSAYQFVVCPALGRNKILSTFQESKNKISLSFAPEPLGP